MPVWPNSSEIVTFIRRGAAEAKQAGDYVLVAVVVDVAGNISSSQEDIVTAGGNAPTGHRIFLPLIKR